jgi:aldose 1-epimerase
VINLCQHSYFNLTGNCKRDILDHEVYLNADLFVAVDETCIPTGEQREVSMTPFDFKEPTAVGKRIDEDDEQLSNGIGYDHTFVFNEDVKNNNALAASLYSSDSGRLLEVFTTEPGVQFYSGNHLKGYKGKQGVIYHKRYGLCLETQHFPDSPNHPAFPTVVVTPEHGYHSETVLVFKTD